MSHEIVGPTFKRVDHRGVFQEILNDGKWEALIHGSMKPGAVLGNHYHKKTEIFLYLTSGAATVRTVRVETGETEQFSLTGSQGVFLNVNESHAIRFSEDSEFIMLKSRRYDPNDPDTFSFPLED